MNDAVILRYIQTLIARNEELDAAELAAIARVEAEGKRVVFGGDSGRRNSEGEAIWEVQDWRTKEVIAKGEGPYESYLAAWEGTNWVNADVVTAEDEDLELPDHDGLPESLAQALAEWVESNMDEAREVRTSGEYATSFHAFPVRCGSGHHFSRRAWARCYPPARDTDQLVPLASRAGAGGDSNNYKNPRAFGQPEIRSRCRIASSISTSSAWSSAAQVCGGGLSYAARLPQRRSSAI